MKKASTTETAFRLQASVNRAQSSVLRVTKIGYKIDNVIKDGASLCPKFVTKSRLTTKTRICHPIVSHSNPRYYEEVDNDQSIGHVLSERFLFAFQAVWNKEV